jgi:hypothetical protein
VANPHNRMPRLRTLLIAVSAVLAVAACQGTPSDSQTTSLDRGSATAFVSLT